MTRCLHVAILLLFSLVTQVGCLGPAPPVRVHGDLSGELVWSGRVEIAGDVLLTAGSALTILPGTEVIFLPVSPDEERWREHPHFPGSELVVRGRIEALGTPERPIVFRAADLNAPAGAWGGVNLVESPQADFAYCRFTQADSALHSWGAAVFIQQSRFDNNHVGIRFNSSPILIENNTLQHNGTGIRFHFGAPVICRNEIRDNERGLFITSYPEDYLIENNRIVGNRLGNVILGEEVPGDVAMPGNDWGSDDPETIIGSLYDGRRDPWLGKVLFAPTRHLPESETGAQWNR